MLKLMCNKGRLAFNIYFVRRLFESILIGNVIDQIVWDC